ncbi:protein Ice2p [[Candida] railenensis]|uniref:Protein Ice2p n=1 Tax=[Candida] railenensis TaxID=45579 RepID=A0A9P0VYG8_9ASCO|nr:protein Ice2p [[Candida] railenensis]
MSIVARRIKHGVRLVLSIIYLILIILSIPLAFDVGGIDCGLSYSFTIFALYFVLTTIRLITRKSRHFKWVSFLYYLQHLVLPSLLTLFLSYYSSNTVSADSSSNKYTLIKVWEYFIVNSTPIFTILEGFCSLLLIQAVGQTVNWLTVYKSDSWLIVSLIGSGSTITAALYFLYRIYVYPFTIETIGASLLGSLLTLTVGLGLFGIVSGKGSMIESSLLFAYIVRCIYETFPILSEEASKALTSLFTHTTYQLKNEIPMLPAQITDIASQLVPFLASNIPGSFKTIWEFFISATQKLTLPLLLNLAYRIGVFFAATKIIPSLYHGASYPSSTTPPISPSIALSRQPSNNHLDQQHHADEIPTEPSQFNVASSSPFPQHTQQPSTIIRLIYSYSPCIIIAVYTHLMMSYNGALGTELKLWGFWDDESLEIVVHPWQFWNWINMTTTLILYAAELMGNNGTQGGTALTSHWKVE